MKYFEQYSRHLEFYPCRLLAEKFNLTLKNCSLSKEKGIELLPFPLELQLVMRNTLRQSECNPIENKFGQERTPGRLNPIEITVKKTSETRMIFFFQVLFLLKLNENLLTYVSATFTPIFQQYYSLIPLTELMKEFEVKSSLIRVYFNSIYSNKSHLNFTAIPNRCLPQIIISAKMEFDYSGNNNEYLMNVSGSY